MVSEDARLERAATETIRDQSNHNENLDNVAYEDHFLTFNRAGNHAPYLQKVIDYTDGRALEFGCGTGTQAMAVDPYVEGTVGLELDADRIELTYERGKRMGAGTGFVRGDMFELPFPDDAFSTAFNSGVYQHFDDSGIEAIVREAGRVSRDYLVLSVANHWYPHSQDDTRRMKPHEWWCDRFRAYDGFELVEHGTYGNRLNSAYLGVSEFQPVWFAKWVGAGLPYPRSWFVLDVCSPE